MTDEQRIDNMSATEVLDLLLADDRTPNWDDPIVVESVKRALARMAYIRTDDFEVGVAVAFERLQKYFIVGLTAVAVNCKSTTVLVDVWSLLFGDTESYFESLLDEYKTDRFLVMEELRNGYHRLYEGIWESLEVSEEYLEEERAKVTHLGIYFLEMIQEFPEAFNLEDPDIDAEVQVSVEIVSNEIDYSAPRSNTFESYVEEALRRHVEYRQYGLNYVNYTFNDVPVSTPQSLVEAHGYDLDSLHQELWEDYHEQLDLRREEWLASEEGQQYMAEREAEELYRQQRIEQLSQEVGDYEFEVHPDVLEEFDHWLEINNDSLIRSDLRQANIWMFYLEQMLADGEDLSTAQELFQDVVLVDTRFVEAIAFNFWVHRDQLMQEAYDIDPEEFRADQEQRYYDRTRAVYMFVEDIPSVD